MCSWTWLNSSTGRTHCAPVIKEAIAKPRFRRWPYDLSTTILNLFKANSIEVARKILLYFSFKDNDLSRANDAWRLLLCKQNPGECHDFENNAHAFLHERIVSCDIDVTNLKFLNCSAIFKFKPGLPINTCINTQIVSSGGAKKYYQY